MCCCCCECTFHFFKENRRKNTFRLIANLEIQRPSTEFSRVVTYDYPCQDFPDSRLPRKFLKGNCGVFRSNIRYLDN